MAATIPRRWNFGKRQKERLLSIYDRHPEALAKRASKDARPR
jgi:hypothetical protein